MLRIRPVGLLLLSTQRRCVTSHVSGALRPGPWLRNCNSYVRRYYPKAPCSGIVDTWAFKRLPYHHFGVYVYTLELHGAFWLGKKKQWPQMCGTLATRLFSGLPLRNLKSSYHNSETIFFVMCHKSTNMYICIYSYMYICIHSMVLEIKFLTSNPAPLRMMQRSDRRHSGCFLPRFGVQSKTLVKVVSFHRDISDSKGPGTNTTRTLGFYIVSC